MSFPIRSLARALGTAGLTLALSTPTLAIDLVGLDASTSEFHLLDTNTSSATLIGTVAGGPPFGFAAIDRGSDEKLYGVAPGFVSGYSVYVIDDQAMTASLVTTVSTSSKGDVGIAVDPATSSVWIAGYVGLSLKVEIHEVDLSTGVMTPRGVLVGTVSGLAFDGNGDLYSTLFGASGPELIRIDRVDAGNSSLVGPMAGVDAPYGLDLSSDVTSGAVHVFVRAAAVVYSVDTATGAATSISAAIAGGASLHSIAEIAAGCPSAKGYGAGCAGTGGFVPALSWTGCAKPNAAVRVDVTGALGGSSALLLFGGGEANVPVGGGCSLLLSGVSPAGLIVPLGGVLPGTGSVSLSAMLPATIPSGVFTMQAFVADPSTVTGYSASNGVRVTLP